MSHRVFERTVEMGGVAARSERFEALRAFLRSLGLMERPSGESFLYEYLRPDGARQFISLTGRGSYATLYLYPDALGREAGHAAGFYRELDESGFELGSKLGPSIGFDLGDSRRLAIISDGLRRLLADGSLPTPDLTAQTCCSS